MQDGLGNRAHNLFVFDVRGVEHADAKSKGRCGKACGSDGAGCAHLLLDDLLVILRSILYTCDSVMLIIVSRDSSVYLSDISIRRWRAGVESLRGMR